VSFAVRLDQHRKPHTSLQEEDTHASLSPVCEGSAFRASRRRVALVTSGLGTAFGGIGIESQLVHWAFADIGKVSVWRHRHRWARWTRRSALALRALIGLVSRPDLVIYTHVDLSQLHHSVPFLHRVPYVIWLNGIEVWEPLEGCRRLALNEANGLLAISATTLARARLANPWLRRAEVVWLANTVAVQNQPSFACPRAVIVGRISSLERYKGHDAILDGWSLVKEAVPGAELLIVGDGDDLPRLKDRVSREDRKSVV
jgi:glycosyltransferase involved in cell wall biosynthesis